MPTLAYRDATSVMWSERNLVVTEWRAAPTLEQFEHYERIGRDVARLFGPEVGASLHVVHGGKADFSDQLRARVVRAFRDPAFPHCITVFAILEGGLTAAATRAFLATAQLLARPVGPAKVYGDLPSAARAVEAALRRTRHPFAATDILALFDQPLR